MYESTSRSEQAGRVRGVVRWVITSIIFLILIAASLFLSAGTQDWRMAWGYLGLAAVIQLLDALVLIPLNPDLLVERSRYQKGAKKWDQVLSRLMAIIGPITIWILSGMDYRYSWSPETPMWLVIISAGFVFSGGLLSLWSMASNKFFIGMVRRKTTPQVRTAGISAHTEPNIIGVKKIYNNPPR